MAHPSHQPALARTPATAADPRHVAVVACGLAVLTLVLLPCVVTFLPTIYFDVDPRSDAGREPVLALGPAGTAWYQFVAVVVAAAALAVCAWAGARLRWGAVALVAAGMMACAYHLPQHMDNGLTAGGWIAAAALGLAALHLGQFESARRWMVAGLVAMLVPMAFQAGWYVLVEHPATVTSYLDTEGELLRTRGWPEGSPQHELYRRRLMNWQAVGAFGLSNVFGSVAAGFTLVAMAVAAGTWRRLGMRQWAWMLLPVVVLGVVAVALSRSMGAMLGVVAGAGVVVVAVVASRWARAAPQSAWWRGRAAGMAGVAVGLVVLAFAAVLVRGAMGPPETIEGERTVLFRFHYWQAAARLIGSDLPGSALVGLGPTGYQEGYLRAKNPLNPEEVTNAHNVFVDYVAMLGLGGWAFSLVLLLWLGQAAVAVAAGRDRGERGEDEEGGLAKPQAAGRPLPRENLVLAGVVAAVVFGVEYTLMLPQLLIESAVLWLAGALAFVGGMAVTAVRGRWRRWWGLVGLLAAATGVLVHNQIEMTFYHFASAGIVWVIVALAAAAYSRPTGDAVRPPRWAAFAPAGAMAAAALALLVGHTLPVSAHQATLADAALALQHDHHARALALLDEAGDRLPSDAHVLQWRVAMRLGRAEQAVQGRRSNLARQQIADALAVLDAAEAAGVTRPSVYRHRARVHRFAADWLDESSHLGAAIAAWGEAVERAPYNLSDHVALGDLHWERSERARAAEWYRRALQISEWNYLDPAKQLPQPEQERLSARIAEHAGPGDGDG